jgi:hypothetical protein
MQKWITLFALLGTGIMIYVMGVTGKPLKTPATPNGILHLELAYNQQKADAILLAWSEPKWNLHATIPSGFPNRIKAAKINTWWDFLFLFFYSVLFYRLCILLYRKLYPSRIGNAGFVFAKLSILAGLFDVVENIFMLSILNQNYAPWYLPWMALASAIKWTLVAGIVLYLVMATGSFLLQQRKP